MKDDRDFNEWHYDADGHFTPSSPDAWDVMLCDPEASIEYWAAGLEEMGTDQRTVLRNTLTDMVERNAGQISEITREVE